MFKRITINSDGQLFFWIVIWLIWVKKHRDARLLVFPSGDGRCTGGRSGPGPATSQAGGSEGCCGLVGLVYAIFQSSSGTGAVNATYAQSVQLFQLAELCWRSDSFMTFFP